MPDQPDPALKLARLLGLPVDMSAAPDPADKPAADPRVEFAALIDRSLG